MLEAAKANSTISSFTLKLSTLEDVFLEVARRWHTTRQSDSELKDGSGRSGGPDKPRAFSVLEGLARSPTLTTTPLFSPALADFDVVTPLIIDNDGEENWSDIGKGEDGRGRGYTDPGAFEDRPVKKRSWWASSTALCNARWTTLKRSPNEAVLSVLLPLSSPRLPHKHHRRTLRRAAGSMIIKEASLRCAATAHALPPFLRAGACLAKQLFGRVASQRPPPTLLPQ